VVPESNSAQNRLEFKKSVLVTTVPEVAPFCSSHKPLLQLQTLSVEVLHEVEVEAIDEVEVVALSNAEVGALLLPCLQSLIFEDMQQ